jgi:predicted 3-demethylubiquinone-9 3-methyltransferase (glyoxalase superfamily)
MARSITAFLMFDGDAEAAMNLYVPLFANSRVETIERYGPGDGPEGKVRQARLILAGYALIFFDTPMRHEFTFTPSFSLFVECESAAELETAYAALVEGGAVLMPLDNYGFSTRFAWISDRFGVSWQLNLA